MIPGMNPRKMQKMMKRMGIKQVEVPAKEVVIKGEEKNIVISDPQVSKVNMMGQETYQIVGEAREESVSTKPEISEEDIKTVMEQTGADEEKAATVIEKHDGDLAAAIMELKETD